LGILLLALNALQPDVRVFEQHWIENPALAVGFSTVDALVPRTHTRNAIGWFFCVAGLLFAAVHFLAEYVIYALLTEPGTLPAGPYI
jgi:hypothetical protein